jgi:demethylmenaquinone methyltransferase/2-methoxy-6-polyprenyl-1,4-benzoquinol methylase
MTTQKVENVKPYESNSEKKVQIERMFDNIAGQYDFLNHFLTAGIDILWRKKAIQYIGLKKPQLILDMATGTGDFAFEALAIHPKKVIGVDLSQNMLNVGIEKSKQKNTTEQIEFVKGDSEALEYDANYFDAITVGFGVRNFEHLENGLSELYRVLKPGGEIVILEPSFPKNPILRFLFTIHFKYITPFFGKLFAKDHSAYSYLPNSVAAFPEGQNFCDVLTHLGFKNTKFKSLTFGICTLFVGEK